MPEHTDTRPERVLVIDDDVELCSMLKDYLSRHGWEASMAHSGTAGVAAACEQHASLIVLDVMLPDFDGFEVMRRLHKEMTIRILLLTARGEEIDRIVGLELGADDYLAKPFNPRELLARMRAITRRNQSSANIRKVAGLTLNSDSRQIVHGQQLLDLTDIEYMLLSDFLQHPGEIRTREHLANSALERSLNPFDRSLDMHVSRLRRKLEHLPEFYGSIRTVRSSGYMLALQPSGSASSWKG